MRDLQVSLWEEPPSVPPASEPAPLLTLAELLTYWRVLIGFSGGKDSIACVLHLLELGLPRERLELWHHEVDGREGSRLFDWPCTPAYCRAFAAALGLRIYFSWRVGGIEGEILRETVATSSAARWGFSTSPARRP